jgi:hypothetical protein
MDEKGLNALEDRLKTYKSTRLVIIDTFQKFAPPRPKGVDQYQFEYRHMGSIKALADKRKTSFLLITHTTKGENENVFDAVRGSYGITGAADGILVLDRNIGSTDAALHVTGRDIEETEYALKFDSRFLSWNITGKAQEIAKSSQQQSIYETIKNHQYPIKPSEISEILNIPVKTVYNILPKLERQGLIHKTDYGQYEPFSLNNI